MFKYIRNNGGYMKSTPIAAKMNLIFLPIIPHNYEYRNIFYCDEYDKWNSFFFFFSFFVRVEYDLRQKEYSDPRVVRFLSHD